MEAVDWLTIGPNMAPIAEILDSKVKDSLTRLPVGLKTHLDQRL